MSLRNADIICLEDCLDDWRGLWELTWGAPDMPVEATIALVAPLVAAELLAIFAVADWKQARTATAMPVDEALALVRNEASYRAPANDGGLFHLLATTAKGEAAIASRAFPRPA